MDGTKDERLNCCTRRAFLLVFFEGLYDDDVIVRKRLVNRGEGWSWVLSIGGWGLPVGGKQFVQPGNGVRRDVRERIAEPGKQLDAEPFEGSDEAALG